MFALRRHLLSHPLLAALLLAVAMFVRVAVPANYMPGSASGHLVLSLCTDASGHDGPATVSVPLRDADGSEQPATHQPCAFASLGVPALGTSDMPDIRGPRLPYAEFALPPPMQVAVARIPFDTPPLRGPPAAA